MTQKKRLEYIDVVAGIMIIWMILGHCRLFSHHQLPFPNYLSFYMPWFFYKSGIFFKTKDEKQLLSKDSVKFLRIFIVYSLIGWVVWSICGLMDHSLKLNSCFVKPIMSFIKNGSIKANGALWFLLSLFLVRQLGNLILKNIQNRVFQLIASFLFFAIAYGLFAIGWYKHSWWLGNICSGLCFFFLGYWLRDKERNKKLFIVSTAFYFMVVFAHSVGWISHFPYLYMHANKMYYGNYILFFPMALAGIVMTNNIFWNLCNHVKFRILEYVGRNSMNFYVTHWILLIFVAFIAKSIFHVESHSTQLAIFIVANIVFLPMISIFIDSLKTKYSFFNKIL